jgi:hypothetical protein
MASKLGLARVSQILIAVSRASPTYGDKPGHDEMREDCLFVSLARHPLVR